MVNKEPACQCRRLQSQEFGPWVGKTPSRRNPLQYPCLENPTDRGAWWAPQRVGHDGGDSTLTQWV